MFQKIIKYGIVIHAKSQSSSKNLYKLKLKIWLCSRIFRSASSSITRPGQIQKNHEKVSEVMEISLRTIYDQLWLVMNCYDQLWAFMTSYELLWLVMNCYDKLWTVMTSYDHGQLWLVIGQLKPVITRYHYLWPVWPLITLIWSVMICYD